MDEILKGNFKIKKPVDPKFSEPEKETLKETLKKKALASLGGSMVYVERDRLNWDGHEQSN